MGHKGFERVWRERCYQFSISLQAALNVYFQARYGQAAQEGAAEASEFEMFSKICATLLRSAPHYGGSLLYACMRCMVDMIHMDPTHFPACWEGGMPEAFIEFLQQGAWHSLVACFGLCLLKFSGAVVVQVPSAVILWWG
jgi:hypothetical protein